MRAPLRGGCFVAADSRVTELEAENSRLRAENERLQARLREVVKFLDMALEVPVEPDPFWVRRKRAVVAALAAAQPEEKK